MKKFILSTLLISVFFLIIGSFSESLAEEVSRGRASLTVDGEDIVIWEDEYQACTAIRSESSKCQALADKCVKDGGCAPQLATLSFMGCDKCDAAAKPCYDNLESEYSQCIREASAKYKQEKAAADQLQPQSENAKNIVNSPKTAKEESRKTVEIESSPFSFIEVPMIIDIGEPPTFVGLIGFDTAICTPNDHQSCKISWEKILENASKRSPSITIEDEKKVLESGFGFKNQGQKELYKILVTDNSQFKIPLSNKWTTLEERDSLPEGSEVNGSWLRLKLDIELTEKVSAVLSLNDFQAEINSNSLDLKWGEIEFKSLGDIKIHPTFTVKTDNAQISTKDTHFWVSYDKDKKYTLLGVYKGKVEVRTKDGKTATVTPNGDKPGVVVVSQKLSPIKLAVLGVILAAVLGGILMLFKKKIFRKKK